jgi:hypothetical protein
MRKSLVVLAVSAIVACSATAADPKRSSLTVTISGDGAALTGFAFPSTTANEPTFVDGWDVRFDRILVTVDNIVLTNTPDANPTDQAQTGPVVARATGPWAVDMTKPGTPTEVHPVSHPADFGSIPGRNPVAQPLYRFDALDGGRALEPSVRYGFGFDVVAANASAKRTNLDARAAADYEDMVRMGFAVLYVGTATFRGKECASSDTSYDFGALPSVVKFRLGFRIPTQLVNCQNSDLGGKAFDGEESQRGVQVGSSSSSAQITLHVDHPFWNTVDHDAAELYFDQMAAAASADGTLVVEDLERLDFTAFKDRTGRTLPWRSCVPEKPVKNGPRSFDAGSVAVDPAASPEQALRHYADYVAYQTSTEGHLNADGLCAVKRMYPAPR